MSSQKRGPGRAKLEKARQSRGGTSANPFAKEAPRPAPRSKPEPRPKPAPRPKSERGTDEGPGAGKSRGGRNTREGRVPSAKPAPAKPLEPMRIQRALARAGVASRRAAEELIAAGRVTVNGEVATTGQTVTPGRDAIAVDGAPVATPAAAAEWIVLNKPAGVLTTRQDAGGRPTVFELVPAVPGLTYVGRLDYMTEGVLLLTTDGDAAHWLTHPSSEVPRSYMAVVRGNAGAAAKHARRGVELEDGLVTPIDVDAQSLGKGRWEFFITITEGRNREVRRVCEALGLEVEQLVRLQFGPVSLGRLESGQTRPLSNTERRAIDLLVRARR